MNKVEMHSQPSNFQYTTIGFFFLCPSLNQLKYPMHVTYWHAHNSDHYMDISTFIENGCAEHPNPNVETGFSIQSFSSHTINGNTFIFIEHKFIELLASEKMRK